MIHHNSPIKLLVRGGSIAAGAGVVKSYADILKEYCFSPNVQVINRSRTGDNSFDGIWTFQEDIAIYTPDILLIHFGVDDAYSPVYRSEFKENLVRMVRSARERFNPVIMLATSHTFDDPYEMDAINIYYRTIREVCVDLGCEMVAVHTYWAGYLMENHLSNSDLVQKDSRLPNEHGHEVFAGIIIQRIEKAVAVKTSYQYSV